MPVIHKYPLRVKYEQIISLPLGSQVLCLQMQNDQPTLWVLKPESGPEVDFVFNTVGTGYKIDFPVYDYVGTYQAGDGFVAHVFMSSKPLTTNTDL